MELIGYGEGVASRKPTHFSLRGASPRRGAGAHRWNVFILDSPHIGRGQLHQRLRPTRGPDELYLKR